VRGQAPANQPSGGAGASWKRVKPARNSTSEASTIGDAFFEPPASVLFGRGSTIEPPNASPLVRWCGRGEQVTAPPIPIIPGRIGCRGMSRLHVKASVPERSMRLDVRCCADYRSLNSSDNGIRNPIAITSRVARDMPFFPHSTSLM
jgi:hypothetical protein